MLITAPWIGGITPTLSVEPDQPVRLVRLLPADSLTNSADRLLLACDQPLVEVSALGFGRFPGSFRHVDTVIGHELRYVDHEMDAHRLTVRQRHDETGLEVVSSFTRTSADSLATWTTVRNNGAEELILDCVSSFASGAFLPDSGSDDVDPFDIVAGTNDWVAESRWRTRPLREVGLARIDRGLQHHSPRSRYSLTNRGSWSTGEALPTGVLLHRTNGYALGFQVEHNGPWLHEVGETRNGAYLLLSGPTDAEHQWTHPLAPGDEFTTVRVGLTATQGGLDEAFAALTRHRRSLRIARSADESTPVIFNDYMNTLMGDPTTEKLLPLITAAAEVGADIFCIDAGWYADGHWWDCVGEWEPSRTRFPGGIEEVLGAINSHGMKSGLWLEPEVIGVHSPLAEALPDSAFFQRRGVRVAEHGRHLLDFTDPAARAHVSSVVDRLVSDYDVSFLKLDYNTMPGPGTDSAGRAPGDGLLDHAGALLNWFDAIQAAHPSLLLENCASGAMRMDYATLARMHLQSTSDQQDPVLYATIAAAAPASLLPEQAASWAYPVPGQEHELFVLSLVNGIIGRLYLSGYLNKMDESERRTVSEAIKAHRAVAEAQQTSVPFWPHGLPGWEDTWVVLGQRPDLAAQARTEHTHLTVWRRGHERNLDVPIRHLVGQQAQVGWSFPSSGEGWTAQWDAERGVLSLEVPADIDGPSARVLRITPA